MLVAAMDPDAIVICTPADHVILGDEEWDETITSAVAAASDGHLVAIGIPPRDPDTTLGYIHALQGTGERCRPVAAFREKPNADDAQMYFQSHDWFWNAGILIWRAESFIEALERHAPVLAGAAALAVREIGATGTVASDTWERLPRISIDYALCEAAAREGRMRVVPATFEWWDLGTWPSVAAFAKSQRRLPVGESDTVARLHSRGCFVHEDPGSTRRIALLGVSNLVVVDVGDVTLIADASSAQNVKELVGHLEALGWEDLI
jgi:mannose-1-phosphate guanylyltransferase